jgi:hypothetical protein
MTDCKFGPDHPEFVLRLFPDGTVDLSVCWDSTNVRDIAKELRQVAAQLDNLPDDADAIGVMPL